MRVHSDPYAIERVDAYIHPDSWHFPPNPACHPT
jgi:hypothetical protein